MCLTRGRFVVIALLAFAPRALAQSASSPSQDARDPRETDADPTRPVFFSLRPEYLARSDVSTQFSLILRYDTALLGQPRARAILRAELPVSGARVGDDVNGGIGDSYVQVLVPWFPTRTFALAMGSGVVLPTATDDLLGAGRWVIAPMVVPVWRLQGGLFLTKFQDFGTNYFLITPTFLHVVGRKWWVLVDSETRTEWRLGGRTGITSGVQLGRIAASGVGVWIKPEVWWGPNRNGQWNLKLGVVWYQKKAR